MELHNSDDNSLGLVAKVMPTSDSDNTIPVQAASPQSNTPQSCRTCSSVVSMTPQRLFSCAVMLKHVISQLTLACSCVNGRAGICMSAALHRRSAWCQRTVDRHLPDTLQESLSQLLLLPAPQSLSHSVDQPHTLQIHRRRLLHFMFALRFPFWNQIVRK